MCWNDRFFWNFTRENVLNISEKLQILSRMYFFNSFKFSTSYVFRAFLFFSFTAFLLSSRNFLKSSCSLIKLLTFITFRTFHQVVNFHHFPNFSSSCWLSSPSELFIRLSTFITFRTFHLVVNFHHFRKFSSSCRLSSLSEVFINFQLCINLPWCWHFFKQKVVLWLWGDTLFHAKATEEMFWKTRKKIFPTKLTFDRSKRNERIPLKHTIIQAPHINNQYCSVPCCFLLLNAIESTTSMNKASNANASKELGNKFWQVLENILFAETGCWRSFSERVHTLCFHIMRIWDEDWNFLQCPRLTGLNSFESSNSAQGKELDAIYLYNETFL